MALRARVRARNFRHILRGSVLCVLSRDGESCRGFGTQGKNVSFLAQVVLC